MSFELRKEGYLINTHQDLLDLKVIHDFLTNSYWAKGIKFETVKKSIENSLCFGFYFNERQIGFARVVSDYTTIAYLADVFIIEEFRGRGLSKMLLEFIMNYPVLKNVRAWLLATTDAHGLYEKFGFHPVENPGKYMTKRNPDFS